MIPKYLKGWFSVGIVCRLKLKLLDAYLLVKFFEYADQVAQSYVAICYESFYLMELCEMGLIQCLIPEHSVYGEILHGLEFFLLSHLV